MPKPSKEALAVEGIEMRVKAIFDGDRCVAAHVIHPEISWKRLGSMGIKLQSLVDEIFLKTQHEEKLQAVVDRVYTLMYGSKP